MRKRYSMLYNIYSKKNGEGYVLLSAGDGFEGDSGKDSWRGRL
jgi:hypothetical protein